MQRSGIDTIKYHTWTRILMGKWQTHSYIPQTRAKRSALFPAGDYKAQINRRAQRHNKHKAVKNIKDPQKKYRFGIVSNIFNCRALTSFTSPTSLLILMWTMAHLGKWQTTTNTTAKSPALSQQVTTGLQGTNTTAHHTPTWSIANKNDPQKKHRLRTASK